ncbi:hypothetical protein, partial [Jatrophihabitans endophyticus]|uniref:hypothetical protein n=1 Tax=Jatrophihabitans endophyticus TaxID=1206085 RepID=UPI0026E9B727
MLTLPLAGHAQAPHGGKNRIELPTDLFVTPLALPNARQQVLNPGLPNYPNFVAGEALREAVSPDGSTLAVVTGGENSL